MKNLFASSIILLLLIGFLSSSCGFLKREVSNYPFYPKTESDIFPEPKGYVNDYEDILTEDQIDELNVILKEHDTNTSDQIAVVTLSSIYPYKTIESFTLDLFENWQIGQQNIGKGVLIVFGKGLRKIRIQNGPGITNRLTDSDTQDIIDDIMIPNFKNNSYFIGIKKGIITIIEELNLNK